MKKIIFIFLITNCSLLIVKADWVQVAYFGASSFAYNGNNLFAGCGDGVYLSTDNGTSWNLTPLYNQHVGPLAVKGDTIFAGTYGIIPTGNGVFLSTNNGDNWTQAGLNGQAILSLAVNGNYIFAGLYIGVYWSSNNGNNWTSTDIGYIRSLAGNGNYIFAGNGNSPGYGVYVSTNNGTNWVQTSLNHGYIFAMAAIGNNIYAGDYGYTGVYLSTNNGDNWNQTSLNNRPVVSLAVNGNNIFAGTYGYGVYVSTDNGTSWIQSNEGIGELHINALGILNNYLFAGTGYGGGYGVYRRPLSELVSIHPISNEVPNQFSLSQNYPNPFNPTTKIKFDVPTVGQTFLCVYDLLGREVKTLVNEQLNPGTYEVNWDASNYPSGIYYYSLTVRQAGSSTEKFVQIRKAVLIK